MITSAGRLVSQSIRNPVARAAILTFGWNHRHEIFRWGRSLWAEFLGGGGVSPARALRTGQVLFAIASDAQFRNAPELRKVTMSGDLVVLDVDPGWELLPRLVQRVERVKGVERVVTSAGDPIDTTAH